MRVRLFGKKDCLLCKAAMARLHAAHIPFVYVDAEAHGTQPLCDFNQVDELPHIQFIEGHVLVTELKGNANSAELKLAFSGAMRKDA